MKKVKIKCKNCKGKVELFDLEKRKDKNNRFYYSCEDCGSYVEVTDDEIIEVKKND